MLSAVLIIMIWTTRLMPLWANIVCTILLGIRFTWRATLTICKFMKSEIYEDLHPTCINTEEEK